MTTNSVSGLTVTLTVEAAALAAGRTNTLTITQEAINATSDDSSRWDDFLVGQRNWTLESENLFIYDDAAQIYLEEHLTGAVPADVDVILTTPDSRTYTGTGIVTSYSLNRSYNDVMTISVSIQGTGAIITSTS